MQLQKAKEEHAYKEQMEEPVVQQLQADVNTIRQKIQEYNTHQLALRSRAKAADEKKDGLLSKVPSLSCCIFLPFIRCCSCDTFCFS
jgi:kinetochore protein Nuf2